MTSQSPEGDFVPIAACATPTEAHVLKETLVAAGLMAHVADANFVQANSWMSNAVGGVRVLVPASMADEARATVAAFNAGAFQLEGQSAKAAEADAASPATAPAADTRWLDTYHLYRHPARKPTVVAVKVGFSWAAFLLGPIWFLLNGMLLTCLLSLSLIWGTPLVVRAIASATNPASGAQSLAVAAFFAVWVFTGLVANFLLGEELKRRGYSLARSVKAKSARDALADAAA